MVAMAVAKVMMMLLLSLLLPQVWRIKLLTGFKRYWLAKHQEGLVGDKGKA